MEFENVNLVRKIAWSFHKSTGLEWNDLFQQACLAYLTALRTYDPNRGKITTHVWYCITNDLTNYIKQEEGFKCRKYNNELSFIEDLTPQPHKAQVASPFWESLSEEAQIIADIILRIPTTYVCLSTEEVEERIIETLKRKPRNWPVEKIKLGLRDLKCACAVN